MKFEAQGQTTLRGEHFEIDCIFCSARGVPDDAPGGQYPVNVVQ